MPKYPCLLTGFLAASLCLPGMAHAELGCAPKSPGAKILKSANPHDVHPDWASPSQIGTSWSLVSVKRETGEFYSGKLVSPRGGEQPGRVYVIAKEWDCSDSK